VLRCCLLLVNNNANIFRATIGTRRGSLTTISDAGVKQINKMIRSNYIETDNESNRVQRGSTDDENERDYE